MRKHTALAPSLALVIYAPFRLPLVGHSRRRFTFSRNNYLYGLITRRKNTLDLEKGLTTRSLLILSSFVIAMLFVDVVRFPSAFHNKELKTMSTKL